MEKAALFSQANGSPPPRASPTTMSVTLATMLSARPNVWIDRRQRIVDAESSGVVIEIRESILFDGNQKSLQAKHRSLHS